MLDKAKIMNGLKCCSDENSCYKSDCPYHSDITEACTTKLAKDVVALIEELESQLTKKEAEYNELYEEAHEELNRLYSEKAITVSLTAYEMRDEIEKRCIRYGIYPAIVKKAVTEVAKEFAEKGDYNA